MAFLLALAAGALIAATLVFGYVIWNGLSRKQNPGTAIIIGAVLVLIGWAVWIYFCYMI
jgi:hypothetical protein